MSGNGKFAHVSKNRLEGTLGDTPFPRLLLACQKHRVTGSIRVKADGKKGSVELRGGRIHSVDFDDTSGDKAVGLMARLSDGLYELQQRLPALEGKLAESAQCEGSTDALPLGRVIKHIEENQLSCTLSVAGDFDRAEVTYRGGQVDDVRWNDKTDRAALARIAALAPARFRLTALPLDLGIEGWPTVAPEPTRPFTLGHLPAVMFKKRSIDVTAMAAREDEATILDPTAKPGASVIFKDWLRTSIPVEGVRKMWQSLRQPRLTIR